MGYYPNPLTPDFNESILYIEHIKKVIAAAAKFEIGTVNTFIGRNWKKTVDENWPRFLEVWKPLIAFAEEHDIKVGIENCPMSFSADEWPGGKNLATPIVESCRVCFLSSGPLFVAVIRAKLWFADVYYKVLSSSYLRQHGGGIGKC